MRFSVPTFVILKKTDLLAVIVPKSTLVLPTVMVVVLKVPFTVTLTGDDAAPLMVGMMVSVAVLSSSTKSVATMVVLRLTMSVVAMVPEALETLSQDLSLLMVYEIVPAPLWVSVRLDVDVEVIPPKSIVWLDNVSVGGGTSLGLQLPNSSAKPPTISSNFLTVINTVWLD